MSFKKIIIAFFLSQTFVLGVFALSDNEYYVFHEGDNLCGIFTQGTKTKPNWLQDGWQAVSNNQELHTQFLSKLSCESGNVANCCRQNGFRYAGVPLGIPIISEARRSAEFLASRNFIEKQSLSPSSYNLSSSISRKEMMKIIINISGVPSNQNCKKIFTDVVYDWGCKYIESALEKGFIVGNQAFRPNDTITQTEALKLIFKARNIEKRYNTRIWQEDYISTAYYLGYIDEKYSYYNIPATRGWIFQLAARTFGDDFINW